jgi:succinyl-CoA synthetase beta subunit
MKLYEYQAKNLFKEHGIKVSEEEIADSPDGAVDAAEKFNYSAVIKAQVLVGGRGKAGGVRRAEGKQSVRITASEILSMKIKSVPVRRVLVSEIVDIEREYYLSLTVDRSKRNIVLIASAEGGVDIEELAHSTPEKIRTLLIEPHVGVSEEKVHALFQDIFLGAELLEKATDMVQSLYSLLLKKDCSLVEINPLVLTPSGDLVALDAKVIIDDNALFKHPDLEALRNSEEYSSDELEAKEYGLSFVGLDGTIGCIVNGAGLAMATMDIIKLFGGEPANFLDVGGSSSPEKVMHAFQILTRNKKINAVLINIFGGITRCDDIAHGIVQTKESLGLKLPLVIRLIGTNEKEGRKILLGAGISVHEDLVSAVEEVVQFSE